MHVAFDAVMLSVYLHPSAKPPKPIPDLPARIQLLVEELEAAGAKIIVPAPVLSEFLVMTGPIDGPVYLADLTNSDVFEIKPFDTMAAVEAAEMQRKAKAAGDKKDGSPRVWQVAKVDRQFVAIAKVHGVSCIYSDDEGVQKMAVAAGINCKGVADLPAPPAPDPQQKLFSPEEEEQRASAFASTETEQQPEQSHGDGQATTQPSAPRRLLDLPNAPEPQPQDSSPDAPPRTQPEK